MRHIVAVLVILGLVSSCGGGEDELEVLMVDRDTVLAADYNGRIFIAADGVDLDCNGHLISGNGTGVGIELINRISVRVLNCRVEGFVDGIAVNNSTDCYFRGNFVAKNSRDGIAIAMSYGNEFRTNVITENGEDGFDLFLAETSRFTNQNRVTRNSRNGFEIAQSHANRIIQNTVSENGAHGLSFQQSDDNEVNLLLVQGNGGVGILLGQESEDNSFEENSACANGGGDARQEVPDNDFCGNVFCVFEGITSPEEPCPQ